MSYTRTKGARAAVGMIEALKAMGVAAAVGEPREGVMRVVPHSPADAAKVPAELNGYRLVVVPAPNYTEGQP